MAVRKRFSGIEKLSFTVGTRVEWLNSSRWQPGVIVGPIGRDVITGAPFVMVKSTVTTRTVSHGQLIMSTPGQVRLPFATEPDRLPPSGVRGQV